MLNCDNSELTINGNLIIDGTIVTRPSSGRSVYFTGGAGKTMDGDGVIDVKDNGGRSFFVNGNSTILPTAAYTIANRMTISNDVVLTNYGNIMIGVELNGGNAASTWINADDATLSVRGTLLNTGTLIASATGNTVKYIGTAAQNVKTPSGNTYYNLESANAATVTQQANLNIDGDFTISSGTYTCNTFDLTIKGNWLNNGIFTYGTRTVTFDGTSNQSITCAGGQSFYNVTVNKSSGTLILYNNVIVRNILTMTAGNINAGNNRITVGYGTAAGQDGTLSYNSGTVIGEYEKYIRANGNFLFPVGTTSFYRPALANLTLSGTFYGSIIAKFVQSSPGNAGLPLADGFTMIYNTFNDGYWSLVAANGLRLTSYNLQLTGTGFSSFTVNAETRILTRQNSASNWTARGTHAPAVGFTANRTGITTFAGNIIGEFCFGDDTNCSKPTTSAITGNNSVCTNETDVSYSVTNTVGSIYNWGIIPAEAGTVDPLLQGSSSIEIDWGATGYNARVFVVENNGCTLGDTVFFNTTVHAIAPASILGPLSVPVGATGSGYSVANLGYTYQWTITGGTTDPNPASGQGTNSITVNWSNTEGYGQVRVVAIDATCGSSAPTTINVYRYSVINSIATGNWTTASTWDCNCVPLQTDNVRIRNGHTVTLTAATVINNIIINTGGTLAQSNRNLTVNGDIIINGQNTGTGTLILAGTGTTIDGTGVIANTATVNITTGSKTVLSTAILTKNSSNISIAAGLTVTNYGSVSILAGTLTTGGTWVNKENSTLKVLNIPVSTLVTDAQDNLVEYLSNAPLTIKNTVGSTYFHLKLNGTSTLTLPASLDINGNLTIMNSSVLNTNNLNLNIAGDFTNNSTAADAFVQGTGTVTFDGSSEQTITSNAAGGETFYNLVVDKTSGNLVGASNIIVSNQLSMNSGDIDMGTKRITVGTAVATPGTLVYTTGTIIGEYQKYINAAGNYLFPIGTLIDCRHANININTLTSGGSLISKFVSADPGAAGLPLSESSVNITNQFTDGYWDFQAANGFVSSNYNIDVTATNFTSYSINSATRVLKRTNGGNWVLDGTHANASGSTCYRQGLTGGISTLGTQFCIGNTDCVTFASPVITGNINVCSGSTEVYSVPDTGNDFVWAVSGGTIDAGQGTYQITVTWGGPSIVANVQVTESRTCYSAPVSTLNVTVHSLPTSAIIGLTDVPENTNLGNYTVTNRPGYTYTWSIIAGNGTVSSGQGTNSIMVNWGAASVATIQVIGQYGSCAAASPVTLNVNVYSDIVTIANGNWSNAATWFGGNIPDLATESAKIRHNVTVNASYTIKNIYIENTGNLTHNANMDLTFQGNYYNYGTHTATTGADINLNASTLGTSMGGTGTITQGAGTININTNNRTIVAGTNLTITGSLNIGADITVTNYGTMNISGNLVGGNANSTWINGSNATLNIAGTLLTNGILTANASGNTINYAMNGAQAIKTPSGNKYWNLMLSGNNTKTTGAALDIDGDLNILGAARLAISTYNINVGGNFTVNSTNATPFSASTAIVNMDGISNQNFGSTNGNITIPYLTLSSQGNLYLTNCNLTVSNTLNLTKGILYTGEYKLLLTRNNAGASNTGNVSSFVDGQIRKTGNSAFVFPTGNSNYWAPIGKGATGTVGGLATDVFEAQYFRTTPPNPDQLATGIHHLSYMEYWDLTPIANNASMVDVSIYWKDASRSGITDITSGDLIIAHYNSGTSLWEPKLSTVYSGSTIGVGGKGYITASFTSFSPITFASKFSTNPLPIELLYFNGNCDGNKVLLKWKTATETNNDYFLLEKSTDNIIWNTFAYLKGNGTTRLQQTYSYTDFNIENSYNYYRLSSFDFDGKKHVYEPIVVSCKQEQSNDLLVYKIQDKEYMIEFVDDVESIYTLVVYNIYGKQIFTKFLNGNIGLNTEKLNIHAASGVYILCLSNGINQWCKKILID